MAEQKLWADMNENEQAILADNLLGEHGVELAKAKTKLLKRISENVNADRPNNALAYANAYALVNGTLTTSN